jgi:DNA polymerase-3 subunit gamma/tau
MTETGTQAYYRTWRSKTFADLVGQEPVARTLRNAVKTNRIAHAYLFCGPRGVGKTSAARILAKAINCPIVADGEPCGICDVCRSIQEGQEIDVLELDAASNRGIDQIREIRERVGLAPARLRIKFYILDEAHMITPDAFNALLKTLEEPPPHAIFVLVTTDPQKIPATIVSRCQQLDFRRISAADSIRQLRKVCTGERVDPAPGVLEMIVRASGGSLRDAEGMLDQLVAFAGAQPTLADARAVLGTAGPEAARHLLELLLGDQIGEAIRLVNRLVDEGADPRQIAIDVVDVLRDLMLLRASDRLAELIEAEDEALSALRELAQRLAPGQIVELIRTFAPTPGARADLRPQLPLEISLVEAVQVLRRRAGAAEPLLPSAPPIDGRPAPAEPRTVREPSPVLTPRPPIVPTKPPSPPLAPSPGDAADDSTPLSSAETPAASTVLANDRQAIPLDDGILFQIALTRWSEILDATGVRNRSVQALVRVARPVGSEGTTLVLGFPYEFHRDRIEEVKNRSVVEDVIGRVVGQIVRVRCILATKEQASNADPLQAALEDPIVRQAISLGARIRGVLDPGSEERQ